MILFIGVIACNFLSNALGRAEGWKEMNKIGAGLLIGMIITKALNASTVYIGYTVITLIFAGMTCCIGGYISMVAFKDDGKQGNK
ncbi:hypothetical protein [Liquorilactobacillus mali]|uniref:Uncharacterized protein n=1 Tax=Liquorilactobacillus mali KCTC 3596 = DSM 20444 TaxID=1046596 RepID=J1F593_9LACO|nr:hypothetical protein [Liquorilactobacillus mali]EJF01330.1 hypothetical protein LMA_01529 [Liquorilactobacillus mali KCTC 3596 = DSM 20444]KRN07878.1 hypothetical protein FD00_GL002504 [Liquorilactobacillus mali KCTC 3596 = DSM 20444]MDC7952720.1 hypothetical protein [Liquorilactobacillus mali]QFQ74595.1 hypothetical protein LM596_05450 [Liquorilactobacillus mali]